MPLISCSNNNTVNWLKITPILQHGEIHIHCFYLNENYLHLPALSYLLNTEEEAKAAKYHQINDANMYRLGRIAVKMLLSLYNKYPSKQIEIINRKNQKPYWLISPGPFNPVAAYFNLSHSGNLLLLAVSDNEIGLDVEDSGKFIYDDIMQTTFTEKEINFVKNNPNSKQAFYTIWTRKEALLKAAGIGLIDELQQLEVLNGNNITTVSILKNTTYNVCSFPINETAVGSIAYEAAFAKKLKFFNTPLAQLA